jgi:hypothetical protein
LLTLLFVLFAAPFSPFCVGVRLTRKAHVSGHLLSGYDGDLGWYAEGIIIRGEDPYISFKGKRITTSVCQGSLPVV